MVFISNQTGFSNTGLVIDDDGQESLLRAEGFRLGEGGELRLQLKLLYNQKANMHDPQMGRVRPYASSVD